MTSRWSVPDPPAWRPRVYAASEGLSVLVLDQRAIGGQAGASARIENYLGFPTGISGQALAGRAFNQAQKFGAIWPSRSGSKGSDWHDGEAPQRLRLSGGGSIQARTVVVASGARYRRPDIPDLADSRAPASPIGPRRSRRSCAKARRWRWSAAAIRPGRRSRSSRRR